MCFSFHIILFWTFEDRRWLGKRERDGEDKKINTGWQMVWTYANYFSRKSTLKTFKSLLTNLSFGYSLCIFLLYEIVCKSICICVCVWVRMRLCDTNTYQCLSRIIIMTMQKYQKLQTEQCINLNASVIPRLPFVRLTRAPMAKRVRNLIGLRII